MLLKENMLEGSPLACRPCSTAQSLSKLLNPPTLSKEPNSNSLLGMVPSLCWFQNQVQVLHGRVIINTGKSHEDSKSFVGIFGIISCSVWSSGVAIVQWTQDLCWITGRCNLKPEEVIKSGGGRLLEGKENWRTSYKRG